MPTKNTTEKTKTVKAKTAKKKPPKKQETVASLRKRVAELEVQTNKSLEDYGKLLASTANIRRKLDVMLGEILKGLFVVGIGPDELTAKCQQMFQKKVVAD